MSEQNSTRRTFLKTTGILATVGLTSTLPAIAEETPDAPIPDDTDSLTYATMGTDKDNPTATVYGNFKCPYTQEFVRDGNLEAVLNEYVTSGDLNLRFRALAYQPPGTTSHGSSYYYISDSDPLISEAALGVWDVSPEDYWGFFNHMFSELISGNVSYSEMEDRMQSNGVDNRDTIIDRASDDQYTDEVKESRYAAGDYGVEYTPTLVLNGDTIPPHHDTDDLLNWIGQRISSSSTSSDDESTSEESTTTEDSSESSSSGDTTTETSTSKETSDSSSEDETTTTKSSDSSSDTSDDTQSSDSSGSETSGDSSSGTTTSSESDGSTSDRTSDEDC